MYKLSCVSLYESLSWTWSHVYAERAWDTSYETGSRRETRHANPQPSRLTAVSGDEPTPCVTTCCALNGRLNPTGVPGLTLTEMLSILQ